MADPCVQQALVEKAQPIVEQLCKRRLSIVTAESCTGGLLAAILSHVRGAGECLHGGFITYSKDHKVSALGVDRALLQAGSVNADVARQMAHGALQRSAATVAVVVTGVLGPDPDEDGAPPGLVYIATALRRSQPVVVEHRFHCDDPDEIRQQVLLSALELLAETIRA